MSYRRGCRPDSAHARTRYALSHTLLGEAPKFPPSYSAEHHEGAILDQNRTSACTGHGASQALQVAVGVLGAAALEGAFLAFRPSPRGIYDLARLREEKALTDDGAALSDVVDALAAGGVRPLVLPSPEGFSSDVDESNVNALPTPEELALEHQHLEVGPYRVDTSRADWLDQLCAGISTRGSAIIGAFVDTAFEGYTLQGGPISEPNLHDPAGGGHCLAITSYRTEGGKRIFRGPNSWGPEWGDRGHFEVTESWMRGAVSDCYVFALSPSKRPPSLLEEVLVAVRSVFGEAA